MNAEHTSLPAVRITEVRTGYRVDWDMDFTDDLSRYTTPELIQRMDAALAETTGMAGLSSFCDSVADLTKDDAGSLFRAVREVYRTVLAPCLEKAGLQWCDAPVRNHIEDIAQFSPEESPYPGVRLRHIRTKVGLAQKELSRRIGLCPSSVCGFENGTTRISRQHALAMARVLGCTISDLLP